MLPRQQRKERDRILGWFENTKGAVLCNCGILTAGYDCPDIEVIILYRATTSLPLFLQMVGRGSRVTDVKREFTILDFGNNTPSGVLAGGAHLVTSKSGAKEKRKKKMLDSLRCVSGAVLSCHQAQNNVLIAKQ